jgi:hypothetical protein
MKKIVLYAGTVLIIMLFNACESFIDLRPLDRISSDDYWNTASDLESYIIQFYPSLAGSSMVHNDAGDSDDLYYSNLSTILNGQRTPATGNWRGEWTVIRNINIFFDNYEKCTEPLENYKQYLGEAHFFRAWFYFNLMKKYGDLPWYTSALQIDDEEGLMRPRDPRTVVTDNILADLDKATEYLSLRSAVGNLRLNREAALGFKTRVALYEGTWEKYHAGDAFGTAGADPNKYFQQVVRAAEELMNGNYTVGIYTTGKPDYTDGATPDADFFNMFGMDNMSDVNEMLLYRGFNMADGLSNGVQENITERFHGKAATWEWITSCLGKDGRPYDYLETGKTVKGNDFLIKIAEECDPRLKFTVWIPGDLMGITYNAYFEYPGLNEGDQLLSSSGFQPKKTANPYFVGAANPAGNQTSQTGYIILRYGEVLLNYAEAKCELDGSVATEQLSLLRRRVGMPDFTVNPQSADPNRIDYGYPVSDALYEIRRERRVEMALEGQRDEDLMRWAAHKLFKSKRPKGYPFLQSEFPTYNPPLDENGLIDYWANLLPNGYQFREGQDYLYSIPQDELTLNPGLRQNPGW